MQRQEIGRVCVRVCKGLQGQMGLDEFRKGKGSSSQARASCHIMYIIMAETHHQATITVISIMTPRHHQVISSKAPPSPSSKDQAIIKYINWTMGSTIKCNGSKPSTRATSSTIMIKAFISIIWAPPHHQGPHGTISAHHVYKHQSVCIIL